MCGVAGMKGQDRGEDLPRLGGMVTLVLPDTRTSPCSWAERYADTVCDMAAVVGSAGWLAEAASTRLQRFLSA